MNLNQDTSQLQLIVGFVLAAVLLFLNRKGERNLFPIVGLVVSAIGTGMLVAGTETVVSPLVALIGLGLAMSPLVPADGDELGVPAFLLLLYFAVVCGTTAGDAAASKFFMSSAMLATGLGAGSLLLGTGWAGGGIALLGLTLGASDALGRSQLGGTHPAPGLALVGAIVAGALIIFGALSLLKQKPGPLASVVSSLLVGGMIFLVCNKLFLYSEAGITGLAGAIVAALVGWSMPEADESHSTPVLFGAILMVALGTAAFAEARGIGMATAALGALVVAALSGRPKLLIAVSPLAVLTIYRAFGITYPDAARALDIGQHYGMIGLLAGILASLMVTEVAQNGNRLATTLATVSAGLACAFSPLLIGAKGAVGLLVGLGFAGVIGLLGRKTQNGLSAGVAFSGLLMLGYSLLRDRLDLTRAEKLPMLGGVAAVVLITGIAAAMLARPTTDIPQESA